METPQPGVADRIAKLERRTRMQQALLVAGLLLWLLAAAPAREAVEVRALHLLDRDGEVRASLTSDADNQPRLEFYDAAGRARLRLFQQADADGLYVLDVEGTPRIGIAQFAHGGGGVALHGAQSKGAAVLYLKDSGSLRFFDDEGRATLVLPGDNAE